MSDHTIVLSHEGCFFYSSSVCCCHPFLISSACQVYTASVLYCAHLCMKYSLGVFNFLEKISSFPFYCFPLFLCIDHLGRLSYLSLLFSGTQHSDGYIFPFLLFLSLLFFSQLLLRPPQTAILPFFISFFGDGFDYCLLHNVMNLSSWFFRYSIYQI